MKSADLGRLATFAPDGTLQNSPVGFSYNEALGTAWTPRSSGSNRDVPTTAP